MTQPHHNRIDLIRPDAPELAACGPHAVGVRTEVMVNPGQLDVLAAMAGATALVDRRLVVEVWYPAVAGTGKVQPYRTFLRDGHTEVSLHGQAARGAEALGGDFPLVIISHGFPGNRMLMSHLGENLASKGYVVASIDHPESTYDDPVYRAGAAFGSTLVNRPLDTGFVMSQLGAGPVAIIGYSMGGYGALISGGAAVSREVLSLERVGAVGPWLERHAVAMADPRLRAIVPIGPWGRQHGAWDAPGMAGLSVPALIIAGSADDISGYDTGIRLIFEQATAVERHLLTFEGAAHNAGAPIPAPIEAWVPAPGLDFVPFDHYGDAIWDTVRMNNVAQHFITAFLDRHLKGLNRASYLEPGLAGFAPGKALGLRWESRLP
jgi:predicted dienelactone hydrolase